MYANTKRDKGILREKCRTFFSYLQLLLLLLAPSFLLLLLCIPFSLFYFLFVCMLLLLLVLLLLPLLWLLLAGSCLLSCSAIYSPAISTRLDLTIMLHQHHTQTIYHPYHSNHTFLCYFPCHPVTWYYTAFPLFSGCLLCFRRCCCRRSRKRKGVNKLAHMELCCRRRSSW